ncbi:MAG: hypothetical protein ACFFBD_30345 [Candidatus Hodarchaeota archaeon]
MEELLELFVEDMEDGVLIVDEKNRIRFLNRPAFLIRQKTGLIKQPAKALIGQDLRVCHEGVPVYQKRALEMIKSLKEKKATKFVHLSLIDKKIFKNTYKALWKDGEFKGVSVISRKVTDRLLEEELQSRSIKQYAQDSIQATIICMETQQGVLKIAGDPMILETKGDQEIINLSRLGSFYMVAIGQGHARPLNTLFGPLPVEKIQNWRGYVYPFETLNPKNLDPSAQGKDYHLFLLLYPSILEKMFDYAELSKIIQEKLTKTKYTKQITDKLVKEIKEDILSKKYH